MNHQYAPIPHIIEICGVEWRIERSAEGLDSHESGETLEMQHLIRIRPGVDIEFAWSCLLHEVLHVFDCMTQSHDKHSKEVEEFIERIDDHLFVWLRDACGFGLTKNPSSDS